MQESGFDRLEKRVGEAIALIGRLRGENRELHEQSARMAKELDELRAAQTRAHEEARQMADQRAALQGDVTRLSQELEELRARSVDREEFEGRKREIETRVETLLERFAEMDQAGLF